MIKQILLCTVLIQGMSTIFIDQTPTCLVFKKIHSFAGIKIFNSVPCSVTILKTDKAKFKAALTLYSVNELFMCKDDL